MIKLNQEGMGNYNVTPKTTPIALAKIFWEFEDELEIDKVTDGMYLASKVDGIRIYPFIMIQGVKIYLEE